MTRRRTLARIAGAASILVILCACGSMPTSVFSSDQDGTTRIHRDEEISRELGAERRLDGSPRATWNGCTLRAWDAAC